MDKKIDITPSGGSWDTKSNGCGAKTLIARGHFGIYTVLGTLASFNGGDDHQSTDANEVIICLAKRLWEFASDEAFSGNADAQQIVKEAEAMYIALRTDEIEPEQWETCCQCNDRLHEDEHGHYCANCATWFKPKARELVATE